MPLQSSGQISLNDLHVEAGGTSGTQASMNDSDIRGLLNAAANSQMTFSSFYGASAVSNWSATLTVGSNTVAKVTSKGYSTAFSVVNAFGSVTDNTVDNFGGSTLHGLYSVLSFVILRITGNHANSGFSTLTVGSSTYSRTAAIHSYDATNNFTQWQWNSSNPFGSSGTKSVSLT